MVAEGSRVVHLNSELVRGRSRAVWNGKAVVSVVVDAAGALLAEPQISTVGLLDDDDTDVHDAVLDAVEDTLDGASKRVRKDDDALNEALRIAVRRVFRYTFDKRPVTKIHLVRL
jgi:ribonuclease J